MQLALQSGLRDFISHTYCQTLCDQWYAGNTDPAGKEAVLVNSPPGLFGMAQILVTCILPVKLPYLPSLLMWVPRPAMGVAIRSPRTAK